MRTKEQIISELLKDGKLSVEDAAILLQKEYVPFTPNTFTPYQPYVSPYAPPWVVTCNA